MSSIDDMEKLSNSIEAQIKVLKLILKDMEETNKELEKILEEL